MTAITLRIVTGSYEHNLLCVALTLGEKGEVFTPLFHFSPHTQSIRTLAWSRKVLVSGANDELMRLYDLQHRRELGTLMHHSGQILVLRFFGSRWLLSGAGDGRICLWRAKDWELLAEMKGHKAPVVDISIHSTGKIALSVGDDRKVILWNMMTARKASIRKLKDQPRQVAFIPGRSTDYIVAFTRNVVLYNADGDVKREWKLKSSIHRAQFYKEELLAVSTENGAVNFYDFNSENTEEPVFILQGHASRVKDFDFYDHWMVSVSSDGMIVVWDMNKRDQVAAYNAGDRLNCVALIPDSVEKELKRKLPDTDMQSEAEASDFSEVEEATTKASKKDKRKKKSRVVVTEG